MRQEQLRARQHATAPMSRKPYRNHGHYWHAEYGALARGCVQSTRSFDTASVISPLVGLTSSATAVAFGTNSRSSSNRFDASSVFMLVIPVTLPPGRARLETSPAAMGSIPT